MVDLPKSFFSDIALSKTSRTSLNFVFVADKTTNLAVENFATFNANVVFPHPGGL